MSEIQNIQNEKFLLHLTHNYGTGLNISANFERDLINDFDLTNDMVFYQKYPPSEYYRFLVPGTNRLALKLPKNINYFCNLDIILRFSGTMQDTANADREIYTSLRRIDGTTIIERDSVIKVTSNTLTERKAHFPTYVRDANDPFIVDGFRLMMVAPPVTMTLTKLTLIIRGN